MYRELWRLAGGRAWTGGVKTEDACYGEGEKSGLVHGARTVDEIEAQNDNIRPFWGCWFEIRKS